MPQVIKLKGGDITCYSPEEYKMDTPVKEIEDLPFVAKLKKKDKNNGMYWTVKSTGNPDVPFTFMNDCDLGSEYARLYLNHLLSVERSSIALSLGWIVSAMRKYPEDEASGIWVGFFYLIQEFARIGAQAVRIIQSKEAPDTEPSHKDSAGA